MSDYNSLNQFMASNQFEVEINIQEVEKGKPSRIKLDNQEKWLAIWWSDWTEWEIIQPISDLESLKNICEKFFFDPENMIADEWVKLEWIEKDGKWFGGYNDGWLSEETEEHIRNRELVFELQKVEIK